MTRFSKRFLCLLLCCTLLCGCSWLPAELDPIVVEVMDLTITLPGYFEDLMENQPTTDVQGFFMYGYSEILITGLRDTYEQFDTVPTLEEYANQLIENSEVKSQVEIVEGMTTFTYRQLDNSESYTYMTTVFAGSEAFWMVTVGCKTLNFDSARDKLIEIVKTTRVS